jgi:GTP-binding protein Era
VEGNFRSGYVSLIGRPNVGKSTLLNVLLGQKVSIVSPKPQTTRNRILGIKNLPDAQIIFFDTPGIHKPRTLLGESMVSSARDVLNEIDLVVFVTEPGRHLGQDTEIINSLTGINRPVFLLINKIDLAKRSELLEIIENYRDLFPFKEIIPVSAIKSDGTDILMKKIIEYLPEGPKYYPDELLTDQIERFMAAEIIREKIMARTTEEIPHSVAVNVEEWVEREDGIVSISANIYVEREGQKGIIIGDKGKMLKAIGTMARFDIEKLLGTKVFLQLWVKVRKGWRDDRKVLNELGYN